VVPFLFDCRHPAHGGKISGMIRKPAHSKNAFTLIEIAIVIVIIGMLVGGILMAKNMIHVGKLRSVVTDAELYLGAVNHFRSQYKYLPGDLPTATTYWAATTGGNGDGQVNASSTVAPITPEERFYFWQQLNLAGFIEKTLPGAAANATFTPKTNIPDAKLENGAFAFSYINNAASTTDYAAAGNALIIGNISGTGPTIAALLKPDDAYNIDRKMDDGLPGAGKWLASSSGTGVGAFGAATGCASANTPAATYTTVNTAVSCSFYVLTGF
jgi:prepilin-type N-terminal cleavage/methylation domain-containing protein